jgi:hypothetical protein
MLNDRFAMTTLDAQHEPVFSVDQLLILHVKSMFGKCGRVVVA